MTSEESSELNGPSTAVEYPETPVTDRSTARQLDHEDPLQTIGDQFDLPHQYYVDGNSLGPISDTATAAIDRVIEQWRELGVRAWTDADPPWWKYGELLGNELASLIGAKEGEVVAANATTVNIHTLVGTFLDAVLSGNAETSQGDPVKGPGIVVNELDFPTDHYAIRAQLRARGLEPDNHLHIVESHNGRTVQLDAIEAAVQRDKVGMLFFPSVLYRSGQRFDVERLTRIAHDAGAVAGFDCAHSVGLIPHEFDSVGVDFAVWCSYKYLNAGPGAIAGLFVNAAHDELIPSLPGWWGHEKSSQFDMRPRYSPASGAGAYQIGTVPVLSAAPLFGSLKLIKKAGIHTIHQKSMALTESLIELCDERLAPVGWTIGSPREPSRRGGHVALEHTEAARISKALRNRGVIVDHRPPNVVRICPAPLYMGFEDLFEVVDHCHTVVEEGVYTRYESPDGDVT